MSTPAFSGFPAEGLTMLGELEDASKEWFAEHKKRYEQNLAKPAKAFVTAIGPLLAERISPTITALPKTNGSIAPINRDVRFSTDKRPYKNHLLFKFWDGPDKRTAPMLWVRLGADEVGFATSMGFDGPRLETWREAVGGPKGEALAERIAAITAAAGAESVGDQLKRVPAPYPADHPREDLLRFKAIQVRWPAPLPASVGSAEFAGYCVDELAKVGDIHRWWCEQLM